ncbi:ABC transporter permease [Halorhabdus sp. CBA1104]|uniref:ABC transporter permease subunit n=1 Tax=unclassified Halorhabdus TaxID=2621901 RepID=UPI0012B1914B|nr:MULTISPECIES: ABC transporter permease subunit [unclassified Halorhabdus]QGN06935.1 ABC transporter permease [Halorhabdus sp. CBA1104]
MSLLAVARRDFLDVRRAKLVWAPVALYTAFMLLFFWGQSTSADPDFYPIIWGLVGLGGVLLVPLIALVAAYLSIAGERESGRIKFTLGVPVSRTAVIGGKLLARGAVVLLGLAVSLALVVPIAMVFVPEMTIEYGDYLVFAAMTLAYALAYVSVAVGISAVTASRSRAMAAGIGFFFVFNIGWNFLPVNPMQMIEFVLDQFGMTAPEEVLELVFSLSPTGAYLNATKLYMPNRFLEGVGNVVLSDPPFYIQGWFMVVILAAWIVVPLVLANWRFSRAQLG